MVKSIVLFTAAAAIACVFESCSTSTTPNGTFRPMFIGPSVGTTMEFHAWDADSTGRLIRDAGRWSYTVLDSNVQCFGKKNVTRLSINGSPTAFCYISFEPNGNISNYDDYDSLWEELPVVTKDSRAYTFYSPNNLNGVDSVRMTYSYAGTEDITLANHLFSTVKIVLQYRRWDNGIERPPDAPITDWYATDLSWWIKEFIDIRDSSSRTLRTFELTKYTTKR